MSPGTAYIWTQNDQESDDRGLRNAVRPRASADPADGRRHPRRGRAAQGPERGRAQGPDRELPRAAGRATGGVKAELDEVREAKHGCADPGRAGAARAAVPRAGGGLQEGARGRPGRAAARGVRHRAGGLPPADGHHGLRSPGTTSSGTWCPTTSSSSAAWCFTRAGSPRWRPARARPWSRRCRSTSTRSPGGARTWSRSTTTWPGATRSGWATSSSISGSRVACLDDTEPSSPERRAAYLADITYGTNNEFGFDYLRDNMVFSLEQRVQREHAFAIIDEVDSILIDEARTPLIISGPVGNEADDKYGQFNRQVAELVRKQTGVVNTLLAEAEKLLAGREDPAGRGAQAVPGAAGHAEEQAAAQDAERDRASSSWCSGWSSTPSPTASCP